MGSSRAPTDLAKEFQAEARSQRFAEALRELRSASEGGAGAVAGKVVRAVVTEAAAAAERVKAAKAARREKARGPRQGLATPNERAQMWRARLKVAVAHRKAGSSVRVHERRVVLVGTPRRTLCMPM